VGRSGLLDTAGRCKADASCSEGLSSGSCFGRTSADAGAGAGTAPAVVLTAGPDEAQLHVRSMAAQVHKCVVDAVLCLLKISLEHRLPCASVCSRNDLCRTM
jgi:hypothetical protein